MVAIIRRAILDFVLYRHHSKATHPEEYTLALDAAGWLFFDGHETVNEDGRYTFQFLCGVLELDPTQIRNAALSLSKADVQRFNGRMTDV